MTSTKRLPFPLQWPNGWKRSTGRGYPKFIADFTGDRDAILRRLDRRGSNVVITSQLPIGNRGLPYVAPVDDPGIAVYWIEAVRRGDKRVNIERVLACDRWARVADNMRAIAKTLEALDGIERWGASQIVERAFAGFAALPPGSNSTFDEPPVRRPWREVLGGSWPRELDKFETLVIAKARHRAAIALAHPDRGGDPTVAAELNVAMAEAETELGGGAV